MACSIQLLGPPAATGKAVEDSAVITDLVTKTTNLSLNHEPPRGLTENFSPTFLSSGNPCLDFFFHVVPDTPSDQLVQRLELAWIHDSLTTLKLVCNLRGVRGTGKSDKEGFYAAVNWLQSKHPKTLALNVRAIAEFGYFKDFPEILYRILEGSEVRNRQKEELRVRKMEKRSFKRKRDRELKKLEEEGNKEEIAKIIDEKNLSRNLRKEREIEKAKKAIDKYNSDPNYHLLFDSIADLFAVLLKSDIENLNAGKMFNISLASKWCPSVDSAYDKASLLCEAIARRMFPQESEKEYEGIEERHYAYRIRERLRKQVLVPLHKALELPEVYMSANKWNSLPYNRVASVAMKNYKGLFVKHDKERFEEYLKKVKKGEAKIAAGALLPHQIIASLNDENGEQVAELQWSRMVEDVAKKGKLKNCLAVCDVSGSMEGIPMEVSVALGLLVSELSEEPWKGKVISFSESPQLHLIQGDTLKAKTQFVRDMDWGGSTDFQKVFDQILAVALEGKLKEDQLVKRVFVFSDMEFDAASGKYSCYYNEMLDGADLNKEEILRKEWETNYEVIQRKYRECGYSKPPEVVFWNLRNSSSTPVIANMNGVAMVSGFSKNLLTLFLEEGGIVNPEHVMAMAIAGEEYKKLVVHD